jgi:hypothetical protein
MAPRTVSTAAMISTTLMWQFLPANGLMLKALYWSLVCLSTWGLVFLSRGK